MSLKPPAGYGTYSAPTTTTTTTSNTSTSQPQPTNPTSQTSLTFISRATSATKTLIHARRPWRELFVFSSFSRPYSYADSLVRIRHNVNYFRVNYTIVFLLLIFLSLLWYPISMIVFLIIFMGWVFLYFSREAEGYIVVYNRSFDDRLVLCALGIVTILALAFTNVGMNVLVALMIGVLLVGVHAAFRGSEGLFLDEDDAAESGLLSVVGSQPLRPTASTSYTRILG